MRAELASLESKIDYRFSNPELLRRALTHSSYANELRAGPSSTESHNEQLEFLGDSILGLFVSEALVCRHPEYREGDLSRLKAHLVSAVYLHGVARRLDLGSYLELGRSEEMSGGRAKRTLLVDALEAVIAAVYLDGGHDAARLLITRHVLDETPVPEDAATPPSYTNFKSALQELAQARKMPQPRYLTIAESGPEHAKRFNIEVQIGKEWSGQGEGRTKKAASQRAARGLYERLLESPPA